MFFFSLKRKRELVLTSTHFALGLVDKVLVVAALEIELPQGSCFRSFVVL